MFDPFVLPHVAGNALANTLLTTALMERLISDGALSKAAAHDVCTAAALSLGTPQKGEPLPIAVARGVLDGALKQFPKASGSQH